MVGHCMCEQSVEGEYVGVLNDLQKSTSMFSEHCGAA